MCQALCFTDASSQDIVENLDAAALKYEQPLTLWLAAGGYRILGPQPSIGLREMLAYVFAVPVARASEAAEALQLKIANASNKLKQLWQEGYVLRREQSASSGGVEYTYIRIA
jgi:DNA-binding MarR family transcriptional regulator